jgi:hypothetical protein
MRSVHPGWNLLGNLPKRLHSPLQAGFVAKLGIIMIQRKVVIAGIALGVVVAFAAVSQPVQAGGCVIVSAKARGLGEAAASKRAQAKLMRNINHWAHKNKLSTVHSGHLPTSCSKGKGGALFVCDSSAKVCP